MRLPINGEDHSIQVIVLFIGAEKTCWQVFCRRIQVSSVFVIDLSNRVHTILVATALAAVSMLSLGCISQNLPTEDVAVEPRTKSVVVPENAQASASPRSNSDHTVGILRPDPEDMERVYQLVVIQPADSDGSMTTGEREAAHRQHLVRLHGATLAVTTGKIDDGRRFMILPADNLALLSERLQDDPYFGDPPRFRTAVFRFTVGDLCGELPAKSERELQLVWFARDLDVLRHGGEQAPAPFGPELRLHENVAAAGAWGFGHEGVVFLDAGSVNGAEKLLSSWPIDIHDQWSHEVYGVRVPSNSFCLRSSPGS